MSPDALLRAVEEAERSGRLDPTATSNLRKWMTGAAYASQREGIADLLERKAYEELQDAFGAVIPFGTGGRRGAMGPGPNRINERTIGESAQGLTLYVLRSFAPEASTRAGSGAADSGAASAGRPGSREEGLRPGSNGGGSRPAGARARIVIAYDTRRNSRAFAETAASIVAAHGVEALLFEGPRSTPELSFAVRRLGARAGIVISASHNPPGDNGFKAYWADGGQVVPPHDREIIEEVVRVSELRRVDLQEAEREGLFRWIGEEVDGAYRRYTAGLALASDRGIRIAYTPLHGTGTTSVAPALEEAGFADVVHVVGQWAPDPDFSGVPGRSPNPENPSALQLGIEEAAAQGADLVLASDPDADRLGAVVRHDGAWVFLNGNRIGVLVLEHVVRTLSESGRLPRGGVLLKTCVTSDLLDRIAERYGVAVRGDFLVGFKYIGEAIAQMADPSAFVFGTEESHGYLRGTEVRDKDAAQAAVLLAERAAQLKRQGRTLIDALEDIWSRHGYAVELTRTIPLEGAGGGALGVRIMDALRARPPRSIAGERVRAVADRGTGKIVDPATGADLGRTAGAAGNVLVFHLQEGGAERITIRPSGTEPKIKMYVQAWSPGAPPSSASPVARAAADARAERLAAATAEITRRA